MRRSIQHTSIIGAALALAATVTGCWYAQPESSKQKKERLPPVRGVAEDIGSDYVLVNELDRKLLAVDIKTGESTTLIEPYQTTDVGHTLLGIVGNRIYFSRSNHRQNDIDLLVLSPDGVVTYDLNSPTIREKPLGITDAGHIVYIAAPTNRIFLLNPESAELSGLLADDPNNAASREAFQFDPNKKFIVAHEENMHTAHELITANATLRDLCSLDDQLTVFNGIDLVTAQVVSYHGLSDPTVKELVFHQVSTGKKYTFEVPDNTLGYAAVSAVESSNAALVHAIVQETNGSVRRLLEPDFSRGAITSSYTPLNFPAGWTPRGIREREYHDSIIDHGKTLVAIIGEKSQTGIPDMLFYNRDRAVRRVEDPLASYFPAGAQEVSVSYASHNGNTILHAEAKYPQQPNVNKMFTFQGASPVQQFSGFEEAKKREVSRNGRYVITTAASYQGEQHEDVNILDLEDMSQILINSESGKSFENATFSDDSTKVAYTIQDRSTHKYELRIYDRTTGQQETVFALSRKFEIPKWRGDKILIDTPSDPEDRVLDLSSRDRTTGYAKATVISNN